MSLWYRIYSNDGQGGPINYSSPVAVTQSLTYSTASLIAPGKYVFVIRVFDDATGIEELSTNSRVYITLDANGNDIGPTPSKPFALFVRATQNGTCHVKWTYFPNSISRTTNGFLISLTSDNTPHVTTQAASITYVKNIISYSCDISGLSDGVGYTISVVTSTGQGGSQSLPATFHVIGKCIAPLAPDSVSIQLA